MGLFPFMVAQGRSYQEIKGITTLRNLSKWVL